jgi:hypothetical protein
MTKIVDSSDADSPVIYDDANIAVFKAAIAAAVAADATNEIACHDSAFRQAAYDAAIKSVIDNANMAVDEFYRWVESLN